MYAAGSKVMHALHGLGTIETIEEKAILDTVCRFAVVAFEKMQVMVNLDGRSTSIRNPIPADEVEKVMDFLKSCQPELPSNHNQRHKAILELIKSGNIYKLCEVVKGLTQLSQKRNLASRDARALEQSLRLMSEELGHATGCEPTDLEQAITHTCTVGTPELAAV